MAQSSLRVKICGITQPEQGRAIVELGASALGFICAKESPRYITPEQIGAIVACLPTAAAGEPTVERIGVFVNADLATISQTVAIGGLSGVQLHGNESPNFCQQVRQVLPQVAILKAFRVRSPEVLDAIAPYEAVVDALLLDAYHPTLAGGTGATLDWTKLRQFQPDRPWFLAGGLTPANVRDALQEISPNGIDLSSGVERAPGDKDLQKVAQLFEALRG